MEVQVVQMDRWSYIAFSGLLASSGLCGSLFYIHCLIFPGREHEGFKQPLMMLLGLLVGTTCFTQIVIVLHISTEFFHTPWALDIATSTVKNLAVGANMSTCVWMEVFYYTQIVPTGDKFSIWLKRNIRTIVYSALLFHCVHLVVQMVTHLSLSFNVFSSTSNTTLGHNITQHVSVSVNSLPLSVELMVIRGVRLAIILLDLGVKKVFNCLTVCYLWNHIKNMESSGNSFSSPQQKNQMRVAIIGTVQELFFLLYAVFAIINFILWQDSTIRFDPDERIHATAISAYFFIVIVYIGVGQALFRGKVVALSDKVRGWCSALG